MRDNQSARLSILVALAEKSPKLGRTAVMKLCYFLQTLRSVPLGYVFTLYSYGPFDSRVLSDLDTAEALGELRSEVAFYPNGYGYEIVANDKDSGIKASEAGFLGQYSEDVDWVVQQFASFGSADLELLSTIVYVDREAKEDNRALTANDLTKIVHEIKPHFSERAIDEKRDYLRSLGQIRTIDEVAVRTN